MRLVQSISSSHCKYPAVLLEKKRQSLKGGFFGYTPTLYDLERVSSNQQPKYCNDSANVCETIGNIPNKEVEVGKWPKRVIEDKEQKDVCQFHTLPAKKGNFSTKKKGVIPYHNSICDLHKKGGGALSHTKYQGKICQQSILIPRSKYNFHIVNH
jgi:uncharacterized protein YeaC (DUF1315 family)